MKSCTFCQIVSGKREKEHVIAQDKKNLACLDLFPLTEGQTWIIPKKHIGGLKIFEMNNRDYLSLLSFSKKVAKIIKKKLKPKLIFLAIEGTGVDHVHVKLYPFYKISKMAEKRPIRFQTYPGYFITRLGKRESEKKLISVANRLRN